MKGRWRGEVSCAALTAVLVVGWLAPNSTESAVANGDTRTITFSNQHTNEEGTFTFMVNGVYDPSVLDKLNWFMRDWRLNEPTKMDPHLFDIIWEVYRESGSREPIDVLSAYRSPQTNAMLRRRSRQVAEHSQHMEGRAIDAHFVDVGPARIRDVAMRMEEGGVGFYPIGVTPWVHIDSGSVRYWPRMSREALTRLFPDGKTVFIPSDGQPMPGYDLAKAEIEQRGGQIQTAASGGGFFAWLFGPRGGGSDDAEESGGQEAVIAGRSGRGLGRSGGGVETVPVEIAESGPAAVAKAKSDLPTGPAEAGPAPSATAQLAPVPAPEPEAKPQVVATLEQPRVESDAGGDSPVKLTGPIAALYLAPLPPRRPANLEQQLALLANTPLPPARPGDLAQTAPSPLPPARPAHLALLGPEASDSPDVTASIPLGAEVAAAETTAAWPAADAGGVKLLPTVITQGMTSPLPTAALALAELPTSPAMDNGALLERAAQLEAPLPPMPIASAAPERTDRTASATSPPERTTGLVADVARLFGGLQFSVFRTSARSDDTRDLRQ
jgi:uncharacterized protein YcbK (DUF882 family)